MVFPVKVDERGASNEIFFLQRNVIMHESYFYKLTTSPRHILSVVFHTSCGKDQDRMME